MSNETEQRGAFEAELTKMPEWAPEFERHRAWVEHLLWTFWQAALLRAQQPPNGSWPDQQSFERWAKCEGLILTRSNTDEICTRGGLAPANYLEDMTEVAWRAWTNKPSEQHIGQGWMCLDVPAPSNITLDVAMSDGTVSIGSFMDELGWCLDQMIDNSDADVYVTHWMPRPTHPISNKPSEQQPGQFVNIKIKRELFSFSSKQQWVNKAKSWYENCGVQKGFYITADANGHVMHRGLCFNHAVYPVTCYELQTNWSETPPTPPKGAAHE